MATVMIKQQLNHNNLLLICSNLIRAYKTYIDPRGLLGFPPPTRLLEKKTNCYLIFVTLKSRSETPRSLLIIQLPSI